MWVGHSCLHRFPGPCIESARKPQKYNAISMDPSGPKRAATSWYFWGPKCLQRLVVPRNQTFKNVLGAIAGCQCCQQTYFYAKFWKFSIFGGSWHKDFWFGIFWNIFQQPMFMKCAKCRTKFFGKFPTLFCLETLMKLLCALFTQEIVFPWMLKHVACVSHAGFMVAGLGPNTYQDS